MTLLSGHQESSWSESEELSSPFIKSTSSMRSGSGNLKSAATPDS